MYRTVTPLCIPPQPLPSIPEEIVTAETKDGKLNQNVRLAMQQLLELSEQTPAATDSKTENQKVSF